MDLQSRPHRRFNPLTREWVLVSPQRTDRPWQGEVEKLTREKLPSYDPNCYLCPGNERARGARNPQYANTFVFDNDFAALLPDTPPEEYEHRALKAQAEPGICRVVCFSPRHDLTISMMNIAEVRRVVDTWVEQYQELGAMPFMNSVQIFENRGAMMGASNLHPHCQIWAEKSLPNETVKEMGSFLDYLKQKQCCLLCDYLETEKETNERLVYENNSFVALVPFWAVWPFETLIVSGRHMTAVDELEERERDDLADVLKRITTRYDKLFETAFPYTMGIHQRPTDGDDHSTYHLHLHFYPPLLRSATVRKFMVGYELLASPQRDLTAEEAARRLRTTSEDF